MNHPMPTHQPVADAVRPVRAWPEPVASTGRSDEDDIGWPRRSTVRGATGARTPVPVRLARRMRAYLAVRIMSGGARRS